MQLKNPRCDKGDTSKGYAYAVSQTLKHVLEQCGNDLIHANLMKVPMMLPGITITTGADDFYPVEQMQMVQFDGETWQELGEILSAD